MILGRNGECDLEKEFGEQCAWPQEEVLVWPNAALHKVTLGTSTVITVNGQWTNGHKLKTTSMVQHDFPNQLSSMILSCGSQIDSLVEKL